MEVMTFVVLEGFSGTGKTSLARGLERMGWVRLEESAHAVPRDIPVADRADTAADYSLMGATMVYSSIISRQRVGRNVVSEGYLISDLAYAKIRLELKKSMAYPSMLEMARTILKEPSLRPDLYVQLKASPATIAARQTGKDDREKNLTEFFRTRYYSALEEIHAELGEDRIEEVVTDTNVDATLRLVLEALGRRSGILA